MNLVFSIQLVSEDVDLLRGGASHDLVSAERQQHYIDRISSGVQILVLAPPCDTHTRARHSFVAGPRPLRDASWPTGRPGLTAAEQDKVDKANILTDFAVQALQAAGKHTVLCLLESPWQNRQGYAGLHLEDPRVRELEALGLVRGAIFQNRWAPVPYAKPTGLITNAAALVSTPGFHVVWPAFDSQGFYKGPLPRPDSDCDPLIGKDNSGKF